ncbi:MAG TPA: RNA polymerase sigma factor [Polyangiaceae bacterium]|nr:RNA polymerase sigma factor [Polyangiaceae bacterium]
MPPGQASLHPSFEQLYERWFDTVSRWVAALGTHEADREDVVQEVFMVAYRRLSDFDGENEAGWLYQIARRKVRDYRRLLWVKHLFARSSVPVEGTMLWTNRGPLDELETRQKCRLLLQLLDTLNADQRAAFVLFEIEGVSGEEIAALAGVPVNTVWGRIFKARQHLQRKLLRRDASKSHGSVSMRR